MTAKKIFLTILAVALLAVFSGYAYASQGEGYFGTGSAPNLIADPSPSAGVPVQYDDDEPEDDYGDSTPIDIQPGHTSSTARSVADTREKYSEDTAKVINSYGLSASDARNLIAKHKDAAKGQGNREKSDRFKIIFRANNFDYLAAYRVAQANMDMGRKGQALEWANTCLKIFPDYMPARRLRTQAGGK